jgi:hypothetical protein
MIKASKEIILFLFICISLFQFPFETSAVDYCPYFICPPLSPGINNVSIHAEPSTSGSFAIKCLTICQCPSGYGVSKVISSGSLSLKDIYYGPDYFEVCGNKHTGSWLLAEDDCKNTRNITLQIYGGYFGFTSDFTSNNFVNVTQIICSSVTPTCPVCPQPSEWSGCVNNTQTRTNYRCDSSTNYQCQAYIEMQSCNMTSPPSCPSCPPDTDWTACVNNEQSRIRYTCGNETGYVCLPIVEKRSCETTNQTYDPCLYADFRIYACSHINSTPTRGNITLILKNFANIELKNLTAIAFYAGNIKSYNLQPDNVLPPNIYKAFTITDVDLTYEKIKITTHCPYVEEESICDGIRAPTCSEGYTGRYRCSGNWLQREYQHYNCSLSWENYEYCSSGCENNTCKIVGVIAYEKGECINSSTVKITLKNIENTEKVVKVLQILPEDDVADNSLFIIGPGQTYTYTDTCKGNTSRICTYRFIPSTDQPLIISVACPGIITTEPEVKGTILETSLIKIFSCLDSKFLIYSFTYINETPLVGDINLILLGGNRPIKNITVIFLYPDLIKIYDLRPDNTLPEYAYKLFEIKNVTLPFEGGKVIVDCPIDKIEENVCFHRVYLNPRHEYKNDTSYSWNIIMIENSSQGCPYQINYTIWEKHSGNCKDVNVTPFLFINKNSSKSFNVSVSLDEKGGACEVTLRIISPENVTVTTGKYILNEKVKGKGILGFLTDFFNAIVSFFRNISGRFLRPYTFKKPYY